MPASLCFPLPSHNLSTPLRPSALKWVLTQGFPGELCMEKGWRKETHICGVLTVPRHIAEYSHSAVVFDIHNLQIRFIFLLGERKMRLRLRNFPTVSWAVSGGGGVITAQGCQSWRHSRDGQLEGVAGWARWAISRLHSRRQKAQRRFC